MKDNLIWINRIVAGFFACITVYICERFKISSGWCFLLAVLYLVGMAFLFEIIKGVLE